MHSFIKKITSPRTNFFKIFRANLNSIMHYDSMRYRLIVALNETSDDILKMATTQSQKCFTKFIGERELWPMFSAFLYQNYLIF